MADRSNPDLIMSGGKEAMHLSHRAVHEGNAAGTPGFCWPSQDMESKFDFIDLMIELPSVQSCGYFTSDLKKSSME